MDESTVRGQLPEGLVVYPKDFLAFNSVFGSFRVDPINFKLPYFSKKPLEDAYDEIELFGFPLCDVFQLADDNRKGLVYSKDLREFKNKRVTRLGKLVTVKDVKTVKGQIMSFGMFLDENGDWLDTVFFRSP